MRPADLACIIVLAAATFARAEEPGVLKQEFLYEKASFPSCHASTIVQTPQGLCAAFFGGSDEGENDVGIWLCRQDNGATAWTAPVQVATGDTPDQNNRRFPCWNPVLFQAPNGPLLLFYKVGPTPAKWWGMLITSDDHGRTWSRPRRLPDGILGPVKNKPALLADGTLLCGSSTETGGWFVHMEFTPDLGATWTKTEPLNDGHTIESIQPALLVPREKSAGPAQALCRTQQGKIAETFSPDGGKTWSPLRLTNLPNPDSGIDALVLADGRRLLVYNPTTKDGVRTPLSVAISEDGKTWKAGPTLETQPGEYSYPAVIQTTDGKVHITYTWKRQRIRHAVLDPTQFRPTDLPKTP
jgi:predicted neuraminidase